jgi:hypothetical protein
MELVYLFSKLINLILMYSNVGALFRWGIKYSNHEIYNRPTVLFSEPIQILLTLEENYSYVDRGSWLHMLAYNYSTTQDSGLEDSVQNFFLVWSSFFLIIN